MIRLKKKLSVRPILPWVGGKYKIADELLHIINIPDYIEFLDEGMCGGLGFTTRFYDKYPKIKIRANDKNSWLIELYKDIQLKPNLFLDKLLKYNSIWKNFRSKEDKKNWYYDLRNKFNNNKFIGIDKSVVFLVLVKTGYNGLMQINNKGELTTAFGFGEIKKLIDINSYDKFVNFVKKVIFYNSDYEKLTNKITNKSFVYLDPLYKDSKQMYVNQSQDTKNLIRFMYKCYDKGALVAMSNSYDPKYWKTNIPNAEIHTVFRQQGVHRDVVKKGRFLVKENLIILR
jgi:DNA adenine methylase